MKEVIQEAVKQLDEGQECVLATVVRTKGSTPQKAGAKLLVRKDGSGVGTLGGGCVEGDIWFAAKEILRHRGGPEFRDYLLNEDIAARDGLVCGGTMYFFLEPLWDANSYLPYGRQILESYEGSAPIAVATVVNGPAELGAKILFREDGTVEGTLGTAELDSTALEASNRVSGLGTNEFVRTGDGTELFVEGYTSPPTLVLVGGGHVNKACYQLALTLGYRVYIADDRPEFSNPERFPEAAGTVVADYLHCLEDIPINANTFVVVGTRGHRYDDHALESAVKTPASYIGLLGSKRKTLLIYQRLAALGVSPERLKAVRAPVGLDMGALTPEELAVSILGEIIMHRRGGSGGPMKMSQRYFDRAINKALASAAAD